MPKKKLKPLKDILFVTLKPYSKSGISIKAMHKLLVNRRNGVTEGNIRQNIHFLIKEGKVESFFREPNNRPIKSKKNKQIKYYRIKNCV